jgi:3-methyladenine DNA glycosylase AlkD
VSAVEIEALLKRLEALGDPRNVEGMARYGIRAARAFGVPAAQLKRLAREIGRDHALARRLWATGIYDARALAFLVDEPQAVTERQMERWAADFDNWAICDGVCIHLFRRTPFARAKALAWSRRPEEFVKRAAFALMATLAVHDREAGDEVFAVFLESVEREADDERNGVRKAVNWALRQVGKRNAALHEAAIRAGERIRARGTRAARWIASDALRELRSEAVRRRLAERARAPAPKARRREARGR